MAHGGADAVVNAEGPIDIPVVAWGWRSAGVGEPSVGMHGHRSGRDDHGNRGEDGLGIAPDVDERPRWAWALTGVAGDSERRVVVVEEFELPVMARALVLAPLVIVAVDLSEGELLDLAHQSGDLSTFGG